MMQLTTAVQEQVASLVKDGYTEGYGPRWSLKAEPCVLENDEAMDHIAHQIKTGCIMGYRPDWQLMLADPEGNMVQAQKE